MIARPLSRKHNRRQNDAMSSAPAMAGVSGEVTLADSQPTETQALKFDTAAPTGATDHTAPALAGTSIPVITTTAEATQAPSSSATPTQSSGSSISMGTVIGACVGAFAGAAVIIVVGVWWYKRSNQLMENKARRPQRKWNKLEEGEDRWESMDGKGGGGDGGRTPETTEIQRSPSEKLGVFQRSASLRTTTTEKAALPIYDAHMHPFAQYHPHLAVELAEADKTPVARVHPDADGQGQTLSWDGSNPFLSSLRSNRLSTGAMSPSLTMAIPTPPAVTTAEPHRWESAEVVHLEPADDDDDDDASRTDGHGNPFMTSRDIEYMDRARENSKGKQRVADIESADGNHTNDNPFDDANANSGSPIRRLPPVPVPAPHKGHETTLSTDSNSRAMQSLIAALDMPTIQNHEPIPSEAGGLRVASFQPTISSYGSVYENEDKIAETFPLPPDGYVQHP